MKKIIHKLKKNRLVSKIAALLTICMILVSSFTVSSFAADEEEATNSITDVWTGVTDSIMSLLGTAQGVFVQTSGYSNSTVLNSSDIIEFLSEDGGFYYVVELSGLDISSAVLGNNYNFVISGEVYNLGYRELDGNFLFYGDSPFALVMFTEIPPELSLPVENGTWYLQLNEPFSGSLTFTSPFPLLGGLVPTFLGTLAVVGFAISFIMLLVYVISRFLRLRG